MSGGACEATSFLDLPRTAVCGCGPDWSPILPRRVLHRIAEHHDGPGTRPVGSPQDRRAASPRTASLSAGSLLHAGLRNADVRGARGRRQGSLHSDDARQVVLCVHVARPALQGRRSERDAGPLHAGRHAVRIRRAAQGRCAGCGTRGSRRAETCRRCGHDPLASGPLPFCHRRAGSGTKARRPSRSHDYLRARVADAR